MKVWLLAMLCCASAGAALPVATKDVPWVNSLGMKFVPVPGTEVLFSIWDTRVQDYQPFATATFREWPKPSFEQGPTHPAVLLTWEDAKAFCKWLTEKERTAGCIGAGQGYRLPTDAEWSLAACLGPEIGATPQDRSGAIKGVYPWGTQWPPPLGAGNYQGEEARATNRVPIAGYRDAFPRTSPVGSFAPNRFGLYDMGGNVWQLCEDLYQADKELRVVRGGAWYNTNPARMLSSFRGTPSPRSRSDGIGFRCVLAAGAAAPQTPSLTAPAPASVTPSPPQPPPAAVTVASRPPEPLRNMPPFWSYIAFADADGGTSLRSVFEAERMITPKAQVKILTAAPSGSWECFPDADKSGQELAPIARGDDRLLRLYAKMDHWATLDLESLRLTPAPGAPWKAAAVSFRSSNTVFQVLLLNRPVAMPWPPLAVSRDGALAFGVLEMFRVAVRPELAAQLRVRASSSPRQTAWRLGASGLAEVASSFPQETAAAQRAGVVDARGAMASPPFVDCGWLAGAISNRLGVAAGTPTAPSGTETLPSTYKVFFANRVLELMGAELLRGACPDSLRSFSGYVRVAGEGADVWNSYVNYLDQIARVVGSRYVTKANTNNVSRFSVSTDTMESLAGAEENHRRLLAGLQKSRRDPAIVRTLDSHFEMMASSLKKAGREARYSTPSAFSSKVLSNHAVEVAAIGARWKSQFENVTSWQVIDFQQRMSATQSARVSAVKEQRTRRLSEVAEAMSRIPNGPAALGKVTLEMEVAPGVWWPVIVFTEDGK